MPSYSDPIEVQASAAATAFVARLDLPPEASEAMRQMILSAFAAGYTTGRSHGNDHEVQLLLDLLTKLEVVK